MPDAASEGRLPDEQASRWRDTTAHPHIIPKLLPFAGLHTWAVHCTQGIKKESWFSSPAANADLASWQPRETAQLATAATALGSGS